MTKLNKVMSTFGVYVAVLILILLGTLIFKGKFLNPNNFLNIIDVLTMLGIASLGMAFVTYSGQYADLSIPSIMAFCGYVTIQFIGLGIIPAVIIGILFGLLIGFINAFAIGKLRANPIIWTIAMSSCNMGLMRYIWGTRQIYPDIQAGGETPATIAFDNLYRMTFFDAISLPLVVFIFLTIASHILLSKTRYGKQLQLIGSNYDVGKLTAVRPSRAIGGAFIISSFMAAVAGIFFTSFMRVGYVTVGAGYDFNAVTAVVLGGMTLAGGRGNIAGVIGGVLLIGIMNNFLTLMGMGTFSQNVVIGTVFITVVYFHTRSLRKAGQDDE